LDAWGFCAAGNISSYRDRRIKGFGPLLLGIEKVERLFRDMLKT